MCTVTNGTKLNLASIVAAKVRGYGQCPVCFHLDCDYSLVVVDLRGKKTNR